ncbi:MAG: type II toxin-antitoxin system prevent-host-death family antitoxin [Ignavibacteria bacterium]|jgi:prevent-host-death family protein|nr:type II toxin-antitoxin system prevent-host-death family antitoxin [Ignavibacteria bacterium]MBP6510131.1 type II toxin-antitoxin system prevent-host-death family antitoxin [Candidatus Kapabacteria bacterium]HLP27511.1 type II toxin-antitoxin system prevent-host-death family antitoxin [Candidatus Didemnitutus sp.]MBK6419200.1 type II toxin-antitoxin system prevent-host-death family antitoxin [Ignavibacteria bacterium]MBK6760109.1 type II toxin-antitoxin system prevent-host-death family antit
MIMVNMHTAKSTLSQLVEEALMGEDVVIARNGKPVARLVAFIPVDTSKLRPIGLGCTGVPLIDNSEFELLSATNPDVYEENPNDPLNE